MKALLAAADFAAAAHAGQRRKGGEVPYVNHLIEVARLVAEDGRPEAVAVAAMLHDVVEDTDTTVAEIAALFGDEVAALVAALTDPPGWDDLPRAEKKRLQAEHIAGASADARALKIADQISNVRDVGRLPKGWAPADARDYVAGTVQVVAAARDAAPALAAIHDRAVAEAMAHLKEQET